MGVSFLLFLLTLLAGNLRAFAPAAVGTVLGFALTLNVLNVDDFIVRRNAERARAGGELDTVYLTGLSEDSIPALAALAGESSPEMQKDLLPRLACQLVSLDQRASQAWPSTHLSVLRARSALEPWRAILSGYHVDSEGPRYGWTVEDPRGKTLGLLLSGLRLARQAQGWVERRGSRRPDRPLWTSSRHAGAERGVVAGAGVLPRDIKPRRLGAGGSLGDDPGCRRLAMDAHVGAQCPEPGGDLFGAAEAAPHQCQPLEQRDRPHADAIDIRLFDNDPAAGCAHA